MTYGILIKQAREDHRLTQEQLAEALDISRQAVSKWEADLSKPAREKLNRLSEILDIPPERWEEIDAEQEAAKRPPDNSRPWKIAVAALSVLCLVLAIALSAVLWTSRERSGADEDDVPEQVVPPADADTSYENEPVPEPDSATLVPETVPLSVEHDYIFGDWPLGEYDPAEIPFLDDGVQVMEHELWAGWFPDGTRLGLVKCGAYWDTEEQKRSNIYVIWAPPVETTGGELDCHILYCIGEDYTDEDSGNPEVVPFENVLGYDGFKITLSAAENLFRHSYYIAQRDDGSACMVTNVGNQSYEADVDEDGVLEIIHKEEHRGWRITDTREGEEGAFVYLLDDDDWISGLHPEDPYLSGFDPERGGFLTADAYNTIVARYVLRDGEMVKTPPTDFSAADYPDAAKTRITFVTDVEVLSDGYDPDVILPYNPKVLITHRQQAYIALQALYELTGLKVDECYCAAGDFSVLFSLVPDGFNQRSFYCFSLNSALGSYNDDNLIPSLHISWRELGNDWSPLAFADAVKPEGSSTAEKMRWYYNRLPVLQTGEAAETSFPEPEKLDGVYTGELFSETGALYSMSCGFVDGEPALTDIYGPYPDGVANH